MIHLILDATIILLFSLFFISGLHSGLIKTLLSFIGMVLSLSIAIYVSPELSNIIYNSFIKESLTNQIQTSINNGGINPNMILESLPEFVSNSFYYYGITYDNLTNIINSGSKNITNQIVDLISPIFIQTIKMSLASVMYLTFIIIWDMIARFVLSALKVKKLNDLDRGLGGIIGIFRGYVFITIIFFCLRLVFQIVNSSPEIFSYDIINSTVLFKHLYTDNIIYNIIQTL